MNTSLNSDSKIKALKPSDKLYRARVDRGLYIEVTPSGTKHWRYRYGWHGKATMMTLGKFPAIGLREARKKQEEAEALLAKGINPAHAVQASKANTFEAVAREWLADGKSVWTHRVYAQRESLLETDVLPLLGPRPIAEVSAAHVLQVCQTIERRAPSMANVAKQLLGAIFRKGVATLRCEHDPTTVLKGSLKPRVTQHAAIMERKQMKDFFDGLGRSGAHPQTRRAAELLFETTVRSVEIIDGRWSEIDWTERKWIIPAERMKKRRDHVVPLTRRAFTLLQSLKPLTQGELIFSITNDKPPARDLLRKLFERIAKDYESLTGVSPHGIRGTFSTWAHDSGYPTEIIEAQLNHVDRNVTRAAYNRAAYLEQRREMLEAWSAYLESIRSGGAVVPFKRTSTN